MRIVVDTNVLVSGIFWNGNESTILKACKTRDLTNYISPDIINEFEIGVGRVSLMQKPRVLCVGGSRKLKKLGLGNCKENGSRKLKMTTGENYILGLVYCKRLKVICEAGF